MQENGKKIQVSLEYLKKFMNFFINYCIAEKSRKKANEKILNIKHY